MNTTKIVANLVRTNDEAYGDEMQAKIYKITTPEGNVSFAVSLFANDELKSCEGDYISYGYAMKAAIAWIDNSDFYL
jgi:hypothetical protein